MWAQFCGVVVPELWWRVMKPLVAKICRTELSMISTDEKCCDDYEIGVWYSLGYQLRRAQVSAHLVGWPTSCNKAAARYGGCHGRSEMMDDFGLASKSSWEAQQKIWKWWRMHVYVGIHWLHKVYPNSVRKYIFLFPISSRQIEESITPISRGLSRSRDSRRETASRLRDSLPFLKISSREASRNLHSKT